MLPKLGILAGTGQLPIMIIDACKASGRRFFVIAFEGQTPRTTVADVPHAWVRMGAGGEILRILRMEDVTELVLAGGIRKPSLLQLRPDWWGIRFILKSRNYLGGDDGLLKAVVRTLEVEEGFQIVSPDSLVTNLLAQPGFISTKETDLTPYLNDIQAAVTAALNLGCHDKGQAAIVRDGQVVGVENEEGTDALLRKLGEGQGTTESPLRTGVLVKVAKPDQETRVDLPTIGPRTVTLAAAAGLAGIVIEASRSLIIDRELVQKQADEAGVFVLAVELDNLQVDLAQSPLSDDVAELELNSEATSEHQSPLVFLIAGEPSGDHLGAALIKGLQQSAPNIRVAGVGGPAMEREGLISLFPMEELSVMGVAEVLPRLPNILKRIRQTAHAAIISKPDVVITIDSPDFCFRVAKRLAGNGIPLIHYVAPSVWAWRPGRAQKIAKFLDHLLTILPFEPPYFEAVGLPCTFVGHPIIEKSADGDGDSFRHSHDIDAATQVIGVLPGSRKGEVNRLLPIFLAAIDRLPPSNVSRHFIVPTVKGTDALVRAALRDTTLRVTIISNEFDKLNAVAACDVAIAASGTVTLELAQASVPAVIAYRLNPITAFIARRLVTTRFVSLINLLEDRFVTPEFLLEDCTADNIALALGDLLQSPERRAEQILGYKSALKKLTTDSKTSENAAASAVLRLMNRPSKL